MGNPVNVSSRGAPAAAPARTLSDFGYERMIYLFNHPAGDPHATPPLLPSVGSAYVMLNPAARAGNHITDCITYVTDTLQYAFSQSGDAKSAATVKTRPNSVDGTALAKYLSGIGWRAYYWNPDPTFSLDRKGFVESNQLFINNRFFSRPSDPTGTDPVSVVEAEHLRYNRAKAYADEHTFSYGVVKARKTYYGIKVEDSITGYRPTERGTPGPNVFGPPFGAEPKPTALSVKRLAAFGDQVKFAYGMTRGADHTFLFSKGSVYEVHWDKPPGSPELFQATPLMQWPWESGIILVPGNVPVHLPPP